MKLGVRDCQRGLTVSTSYARVHDGRTFPLCDGPSPRESEQRYCEAGGYVSSGSATREKGLDTGEKSFETTKKEVERMSAKSEIMAALAGLTSAITGLVTEMGDCEEQEGLQNSGEIKCCPFCGCTDCVIESCGGEWYVSCSECEADGPMCESIGEAVAMWNYAGK